mmetsp:Transcript_13064/g.20288  ORF Transcript_13064/g.20288 Transcript_13064/m.20288 type:complete len:140 (+) Transcript_13064:4193-4612(+)
MYYKGVYNNTLCQTDRDEDHLYKFKHKRFNPLMNLMAGFLLNRKGIITSTNKVELSNILEKIDEIFGKASPYKTKTSKKYENSYEPSFGFRIQVQRLHGLTNDQLQMQHLVVTSLVPPGRLLQAKPTTGPDVHEFRDVD